MFEMSLVESSGRCKSKASRYMWVTGAFNVAVVAVMMLLPLLRPEALIKADLVAMLTAPPPPPPQRSRPAAVVKAATVTARIDPFTDPVRVPARVDITHEEAPPPMSGSGIEGMNTVGANGLGPAGAMSLGAPPPIAIVMAPLKAAHPTHISSGVVAGNKLSGTSPVYPAIAKAAHVSGTVVLHAIISRTGAIQSLSVVSGPEMLRGNALLAVQEWRYRPYLLNGEPTEVDTTITVNFSFGS